MRSFVAAVCLVLTSQVMSAQICQPPQSETAFYRTGKMEDIYMAQDFTRGLVLIVFQSNDGQGDSWSVVDLNTRTTYMNFPDTGCQYINHPVGDQRTDYELFEQCLPDDAALQRSGAVDFYYMERPGLKWLVGMKPVPDTQYFYMHFSRFWSQGISGVGKVLVDDTFGVVYKYSVGLSDPNLFDKDLSACVPGPEDS